MRAREEATVTQRRTVAPPEAARAGGGGWYARHRSDIWVALIVLLVTAPVVQYMMAQQESRWALTAAVWDQRTFSIDDYEHIIGVDRAVKDGHLYSDKAPGQPLLAVPAYALYRAVGGEPGTFKREIGNLGLWWVSLWTVAIPAAMLAVLMRRFAAQASPRWATAAALSLALGTLLLPFSTVLFAHVLSALCGLGAFLAVQPRSASPARLAAGGLLAGCAVLAEYTLAMLVVVLGVIVAARHGRRVVAYLAGGAPAALALLAYNAVVFGGPLEFSYRYSAGFGEAHAQGILGVRLPDPEMLARITFGERGLFLLTPVVLAGVAGGVLLARRRSTELRFVGTVGLLVFGLFLLIQAGWSNATGGASPGPRYVVPGLPFLAAGVAAAYERKPLLVGVASVIGVLTMGLATFTLPLAQPTERFALGHWIWRVGEGRIMDTLLTMRLGDWTILAQVVLAAGLAAWLLVTERRFTTS